MPEMTLGNSTDQLAALIAAKLQLVEILNKLGRRQLALIESGEISDLVKLLAAKQTVLAQLQAVERQLNPFREEDPDQRAWRSPESRQQCQSQADRCNALLSELMELERRAEEAMHRRRDLAARAMTSAQSAADARSAYANLSQSSTAILQTMG